MKSNDNAMRIKLFFGIPLLFYSQLLLSQGVVLIGGTEPDSSAMMQVISADKGVLLPRMTFAERNAIAGPAEGLLVYCTDCGRDGAGLVSMFQGGEWLDMNLSCYEPFPPQEGMHIPSVTQITWIWKKSHIALGYKWNSTNDYNTATDLGMDTTITETGLTCWTDYTRYIWAYNDCGHSSPVPITKKTSMGYIAPPVEAVNAVALDSIIWKWHQVAGATGYKWNSVNDYATAEDRGTDTTKSDTSLSCGTIFTSYAWAYNACGYSVPVTLTDTTLWCCGTPFTITHSAGDVAPVTKTTTYGTVDSIPGEILRCWTTSNLGSDHQATSLDDNTEASAGWYWQFSRKQGFKHDGTNRTPNTAWIISYPATGNWSDDTDPCRLLLSNNWRLPTKTELFNIDSACSWTDGNSAWNSALKIHQAGYLSIVGTLSSRGVSGYLCSSTTIPNTNVSFGLQLNSMECQIAEIYKIGGYPVRCIRNWLSECLPTVTTATPINITLTSATSGGNVISDGDALVTARGVCWDTLSNPTIADSHTSDGIGTGTFTSSITGLTGGTMYYLRAYATNLVGTAYGNELNFIARPCGDSLMIIHDTIGNVAPVNKTVTYGTATNVPGETTKCWITQNLGADHQATAVNDATEASAGWHWQFNLQQGYKHDGTTRTPNTTWITGINENSDWLAANDPCALLLGSTWRMPTYTEWYNVDNTGGWTNWNHAWASALKLHAAGWITNTGNISQRGAAGYYWSTLQSDVTHGYDLSIFSTNSAMYSHVKEDGFSLRCIRDD